MLVQSEFIHSFIMENKSNTFFVDLQGFTEAGRFYLKELCILECLDDKCEEQDVNIQQEHDNKIHHYIFKPPFSWSWLGPEARTRALWLKCFHHGFSWNHGDTEYSKIESTINTILANRSDTATVYVKGDQKVVWFNHFTRGKFKCLNIEDLGCTINLRSLRSEKEMNIKHCGKHNALLHCAQENVDLLHEWLKVYRLDLNKNDEKTNC